MEKVKLQAKYKPEYEMVELCGQEVQVKKQITYEEKLDYAHEYAAAVCVIDEKQELAYRAYDNGPLEIYLFCKYYTNIDVEEFEFDMESLYDAIKPYWHEMKHVCLGDYYDCDGIAETYVFRTIEIYEKQHSLSQKVKMSLSGVLNGEDLIESIAESRLVNEEMIDLLSKAKKQDEQNSSIVAFPWAAKKTK